MSKSADTESDFQSTPPDREALLDELARCFILSSPVSRKIPRNGSNGVGDLGCSSDPDAHKN
jgi:hypothetical protein